MYFGVPDRYFTAWANDNETCAAAAGRDRQKTAALGYAKQSKELHEKLDSLKVEVEMLKSKRRQTAAKTRPPLVRFC